MNNGPKLWAPIIEALTPIYGSVIIAGGSPRDYVVHRSIKPKDFDVFVPIDSEFDLELTIPDLTYRDTFLVEPGGDYPAEDEGGNVRGVLQTYTADGLAVNIIGKKPEAIEDANVLMADFDHSMCQFWVNSDKPEEVFRTEAADLSLRTGEIELFKEEKNTQRRLRAMRKRAKSYERFTWKGHDVKLEPVKWASGINVANYYAAFDELMARPQPVRFVNGNEMWQVQMPRG